MINDQQPAALNSACELAVLASTILKTSNVHLATVLDLANATGLAVQPALAAIHALRDRLSESEEEAVSSDILFDARVTMQAARQAVRSMAKAELQMAALIGRDMGHESPYLFPVIGNQATAMELRDCLALVCDQARHIVTCARRTHGDAMAMHIDLICRRIDRMLAIGESNVEAGMEALTAMGTLHIKTLKFIRVVEQANLSL